MYAILNMTEHMYIKTIFTGAKSDESAPRLPRWELSHNTNNPGSKPSRVRFEGTAIPYCATANCDEKKLKRGKN